MKSSILVVSLPDAQSIGVSARARWLSISRQRLNGRAGFICSFYFRVAKRKAVLELQFLRYTLYVTRVLSTPHISSGGSLTIMLKAVKARVINILFTAKQNGVLRYRYHGVAILTAFDSRKLLTFPVERELKSQREPAAGLLQEEHCCGLAAFPVGYQSFHGSGQGRESGHSHAVSTTALRRQ